MQSIKLATQGCYQTTQVIGLEMRGTNFEMWIIKILAYHALCALCTYSRQSRLLRFIVCVVNSNVLTFLYRYNIRVCVFFQINIMSISLWL